MVRSGIISVFRRFNTPLSALEIHISSHYPFLPKEKQENITQNVYSKAQGTTPRNIIKMETNMNQRLSSTTTAKPLKPRKFRSSCDACSASKVKCDQQQPRCLRCINLGVHCNYSPSRRMGKPPASARKLKTSSNTSSESEQQSESHPRKKRQLYPPSFIKDTQQSTPESTQARFDTMLMDTDTFMSLNWQYDAFGTSGFVIPSTTELQLSAENLFDLSLDFIDNSTAQISDNAQYIFGDDSSVHSSRSQSHEPIFEVQQVPQPSSQPPKSSSFVHKVSLKLCTHNLDLVRNSLPSPYSRTNTIDQVLADNRAAIEQADALLACSCSDNSHFALTLALICNKILGLYEEVSKAAATGRNPPTPGTRNSGSGVGITVDSYNTDADDDERMWMQIVVNELRKVKGLVDRYANKYCKKGKGLEVGGGIYSALEAFLRSRLTTTLWELLGRLEG